MMINTIGVVTCCDSNRGNRAVWVDACTTGGGGARLPVTRLRRHQSHLKGFSQFWEVVIQDQQVQYLRSKKVNSYFLNVNNILKVICKDGNLD